MAFEEQIVRATDTEIVCWQTIADRHELPWLSDERARVGGPNS